MQCNIVVEYCGRMIIDDNQSSSAYIIPNTTRFEKNQYNYPSK